MSFSLKDVTSDLLREAEIIVAIDGDWYEQVYGQHAFPDWRPGEPYVNHAHRQIWVHIDSNKQADKARLYELVRQAKPGKMP
jgi:hypothetical protein